MRVAFFSPLPPSRSGIADYSETLIEHLKPLAEVEVFSGDGRSFDPARFDIALYHLGNNPYHALRLPGRSPASRRGGDARIQSASPGGLAHHPARRLGRLPARVRIRRRPASSGLCAARAGSRSGAGLRRRSHDPAGARIGPRRDRTQPVCGAADARGRISRPPRAHSPRRLDSARPIATPGATGWDSTNRRRSSASSVSSNPISASPNPCAPFAGCCAWRPRPG